VVLVGKIAASSGHASWVSSKESRNLVFELRGRSDAVIVGGNTVRQDGINLHFVVINFQSIGIGSPYSLLMVLHLI